MILKLGVGRNCFEFHTGVTDVTYSLKNLPPHDIESVTKYRDRVQDLLPACKYETVYLGSNEHDNWKEIDPSYEERYESQQIYTDGESPVRYIHYRTKTLDGKPMYVTVFTPFICYLCNDDGKTLETLK